jgi:hypothetical protein
LEQLFIQAQEQFREQFYPEGYKSVGKLVLRVLPPYRRKILFDKVVKELK